MSGESTIQELRGSAEITNRLKVVVPVFSDDLDTIRYFVDEQGEIFKTFDELLLSPAAHFYFFEYDMVWRCFERWYKENDFVIKFQAKPYSGTLKKQNFIVPNITVPSFITGLEAPRVFSTRGGYKGKSFYFFDLYKFIRGVNIFSAGPEDLPDIKEALAALETTWPARTSRPKSIAGLARSIFGKPTIMNDSCRAKYCCKIKSAYRGGLYYLKKINHVFPVVYDYDIRSMYPFILTTQLFPNPKTEPQLHQGFVEVDNKKQLAIYHIKSIKAQRKPTVPFNTMFTVQEEQDRLIKCGFLVSRQGKLEGRHIPLIEAWITSVDYLILCRDYDIEELTIDRTYVIDDLINGKQLFGKLEYYFHLKQNSTGYLRTAYKVLIDSYSGSLGAIWPGNYKMSSMDINDREILKGEPSNPAPVDIAAFMTAYGRLYITKLAMLCEPGTIQSIDTDGIFTTAPAPKLEQSVYFGDELGDMRLDKTMYEARWFGNKQYESREDSPDADFTPHIAGLPAYLYEHGRFSYSIPRFLYSMRENKFYYQECDFEIYDEEIDNDERTY